MKKQKQHVEHFLITIDLCPLPMRLHSYVMTNDKHCLEGVWNKMFDVAEKQGWKIMIPMVLQTTLSTGAEIVREIICKLQPEVKPTMDAATDFHLSMFSLSTETPEDKVLMDLH